MKKLFIIFCLISNSCYGQQNNVTIKGNINGIGNDTVFIWRYLMTDIGKTINDTIIANEGKFKYELELKEPAALFTILPRKSFINLVDGTKYMPPGRFVEVFLSPKDDIEIIGKLESYYLDYLVKGSAINEVYSEQRKKYKSFEIEIAKIELKIDSLSEFPNTKEESDKLFNERVKKQSEVSAIKTAYINLNLSSDISAYYLTGLSLDEFANSYPKLSEKVRNGFFKNVLENRYNRYLKYNSVKSNEKKLISGARAPDFQLKDVYNQDFTLSDLKGKIIVLDFWGSWCGPCIKEIPSLKSLARNLKDKVYFIGIACKDKKEDLIQTIKQHQIDWLQLMNSNENDISVLYGIQAYPTKIIIDKELRIFRRFVGIDEEFYKTLDELTK